MIEGLFKSILENKNNDIDIEYINEYQHNYIQLKITPEINKLIRKHKVVIQNKIKEIENIINKIRTDTYKD